MGTFEPQVDQQSTPQVSITEFDRHKELKSLNPVDIAHKVRYGK